MSAPKSIAFSQSDSSFQLCDIAGAMTRSVPDIIDFPALERELQGVLEAEGRFTRKNDSKLRAVHQRVASYSEFR